MTRYEMLARLDQLVAFQKRCEEARAAGKPIPKPDEETDDPSQEEG